MQSFPLSSTALLAAFICASFTAPGQPLPVPAPGRGSLRAVFEGDKHRRVHELAEQAARSPGLSSSLKPQFHLAPPQGWMNDPNGPLEYKQVYHLFYQFNPVAPRWGAPYWGHVASKDLVHWQQLPEALSPDADYDADGVFSGSATLLANGTPAIMFTGVSRWKELGYFFQVQALATPVDASDTLLRRWHKRPAPVIPRAPPGGNHAQFRDPTTAVWVGATGDHSDAANESSGSYFLAVGVQLDCQGAAALYEAGPTFDSWAYRGVLFSIGALTQGNSSNLCPQPQRPAPASEEQVGEELATCPAFSAFGNCPMWECPDWFQLGAKGISVFKYSDQVAGRLPFGRDWYVLSDQPVDLASRMGQPPPSLSSTSPSAALFSNTIGGKVYMPQLLDHGEVYASKAFTTSSGRVVWWGWAFEASLGCTEMCGEGTNLTSAMGWQGAQTLPREITYDQAAQTLLLNPVEEVKRLRGRQLFGGDLAFRGVSGSRTSTLVEASAAASNGSPLRQLEILASFNLSSVSPTSEGQQRFDFSVGVIVSMGQGSQLVVSLNGTVADDSPAGPQLADARMWVDTRDVGGATQGLLWGGSMQLPAGGLPATNLQLRVFVDGSLVEAYGLSGRQRATVRVYPLDPSVSWGISLFGHVPLGAAAAMVQVWELGSCWVKEL